MPHAFHLLPCVPAPRFPCSRGLGCSAPWLQSFSWSMLPQPEAHSCAQPPSCLRRRRLSALYCVPRCYRGCALPYTCASVLWSRCCLTPAFWILFKFCIRGISPEVLFSSCSQSFLCCYILHTETFPSSAADLLIIAIYLFLKQTMPSSSSSPLPWHFCLGKQSQLEPTVCFCPFWCTGRFHLKQCEALLASASSCDNFSLQFVFWIQPFCYGFIWERGSAAFTSWKSCCKIFPRASIQSGCVGVASGCR